MITTAKLTKPFRNRDLYVPQFVVKLENRELDSDVVNDIIQVTYRDNIEQIDGFDLAINNWDADKRQLKYTDSSLFDPGKRLTLQMGYRGQGKMRTMISGTIKSLRMTYPASGGPQLSVSGVNVLDEFRGEQESHVYGKEGKAKKPQTDSDIAKEIAGRLNVKLRTNPAKNEEAHDYMLQDNQLDIVFLLERARTLGYELTVEESEGGKPQLYFGPSGKSSNNSYDLKYGLTLTQFTTTLNTSNQVNEVIVRAADPKNKKAIEEKAQRSELKVEALQNAARMSGLKRVFKSRSEVTADVPVHTPKEAKTLALRKLERIAKELIKGSGATVGLPDLLAGRFVGIHGIGEHFSGRYFVTGSTHTISNGGYTTQFECRRE